MRRRRRRRGRRRGRGTVRVHSWLCRPCRGGITAAAISWHSSAHDWLAGRRGAFYDGRKETRRTVGAARKKK